MRMLPLFAVLLLSVGEITQAADYPVLPLWKGSAPGSEEFSGEEQSEARNEKSGSVTRIGNITQPTLTVVQPAKDSNGAAVLIFPGGGYNILAWDKEGIEVAEWLAGQGLTGFVLKYRLPQDAPREQRMELALLDAERAMRLIRSRAKEWKIDPERVGVLGFSAGGHLAYRLATRTERTAASSPDPLDRLSARPAFQVLVYPAYIGEDPALPKDTPPAFLIQTADDDKYVASSVNYFKALDAAGIPAAVHIFAEGGHGYGLREKQLPVSKWPELCEDWLREIATK